MSAPASLWCDSPYTGLLRASHKWPQRPFLAVLPETAARYGIEAGSLTFGEVHASVDELAARFRACGIGPGERVGLMLGNQPNFFVHWFALNALGVSAVPLNADWRVAELQYVIGHSEIRLAIAPGDRHADLAAAAAGAARKLAVCGVNQALPDLRGRAASDLPAMAADPPLSVHRRECALLYTSGTTAQPKGCVLSNEYFVWAGQWYATVGGLCRVREGVERMLTPLPTSHMNAMASSTMCMLLAGGCLIALDRFHPANWWDNVRASRATIVHYLGVMPAMLLGAPARAHDREHDVVFGFGAGVNAVHHAPFEQRFGFPLLEAWAMTETGAGAVMIAHREPRQVGTACFGHADQRVEYTLRDEQGMTVPKGEAGELWVRAAGDNPRFGFFDRYLKDDAATVEAWKEGWFHTGDVVREDAVGALHFVDRKKNVIRRSGENIAAVEVEGALGLHPDVREVAVVAVPDDIRGEEILACIVPGPIVQGSDRSVLARDLARFTRERLAYYKIPGYVHFCEALPRTVTQKIQRGDLRRLGARVMQDGAFIDLRTLKKRSSEPT